MEEAREQTWHIYLDNVLGALLSKGELSNHDWMMFVLWDKNHVENAVWQPSRRPFNILWKANRTTRIVRW